MQTTNDLYIAGEWVAGTGKDLSSINPATGKVLWNGKAAAEQQVVAAIAAARNSLAAWKKLTLNERTAYLEKFTQILSAKQNELTESLAQETGKPIWEAKTELTAMLGKLEISQ